MAGIQKEVKVIVLLFFRKTLIIPKEPLFDNFGWIIYMFHLFCFSSLFFQITLLFKSGIHCFFVLAFLLEIKETDSLMIFYAVSIVLVINVVFIENLIIKFSGLRRVFCPFWLFCAVHFNRESSRFSRDNVNISFNATNMPLYCSLWNKRRWLSGLVSIW